MSSANPNNYGDYSNRTIKGYELREQVGSGGFGAVYRAFQPAVGREVAVKVIRPERASQLEFIRRFEVEAQLIARLEHPHIVPLYDYWRDPDGAFLVMRWLPDSLRASLRNSPWSVEATARLLEQIAGGLTIAHRNGVVHRDIKPDNILLDEDSNAYLADFGIAKDLSARDVTEEEGVIGSPAYITPEQIKGETVTPRADIYSLGVVIYETLIGERPYPDATTPAQLIHKHLSEPLPLLNTHRANLPAALNEVLQTATAKEPMQRYTSVLRFAGAFRAALPNLQRAPAQPLAEPLTEREIDILKLMIEGLSTKEIAARLHLSNTTVRWYVGQIYIKFDVHSRHQAIERAQQLNLLNVVDMASLAGLADESETAFVKEASGSVASILGTHMGLQTSQAINPYKGLRAFQEADALDFFGRAALTERLLARLSETGDGARFLAVVGASGSGKSSVTRAGLIPALRKGGLLNSGRWLVTEMLPGTHPFEELEAALLRISSSPVPGMLDQLTEDRRGLARVAKRLLPVDQGVELVLLIDQFEELFTLLEDESTRAHFIDNLLSVVTDPRSRVRVILTIRADFYDRPLAYRHLAELVRSHTELVMPLNDEELERAIVGPAERLGLNVEPALVAAIVKEVGEQPGALPLLQYALTELFERRAGDTLTVEAYHETGGITGALARRADALYDELDAAGQEAARQLFLRLVTPGEGVEDTRRRALQIELNAVGGVDDVIAAFTQYRLLTLDRDPLTRSPTVEIAHEALIRTWDRLRDWLADAREDLYIQRRLAAAVADWSKGKRDPSFLASGARLTQFEALATSGQIAMNADETGYLQASVVDRERREHEAEAQRERELELARQAAASQRRAAIRLRYLAGALTVFLLIAAGLSAFAINNAAMARTEATHSNALRLAAEANYLLQAGINTETAALLAIRAMNIQYVPQADAVLSKVSLYDFTPRQQFIGHTDVVNDVAFSPDGKTLLTGSIDKTARLWDVQTGKEIRQFVGPDAEVWSVAFSPDGKTILTSGPDKTARLWDAQTGQQIRQFVGHTQLVHGEAFSPDGKTILTGSWDKTARLWDAQTGQQIRQFLGHTDLVESVAFSPDGKTVLTGSFDNTARLWDTQTGQQIRQFVGHDEAVWSVAFSPDGKTVLTGSLDRTVRLWDTQTGQQIRQFVGHTDELRVVAYSPDGKTVLTGSLDKTARLWDVQTGQELHRFIQSGAVMAVAFSPDGQFMATNDRNSGVVRLWDVQKKSRLPTLRGHTAGIALLRFSPDGKTVVTAATSGNGGVMDSTARLWDAQTGNL
ncbi:MAG TPA: protein kinase, partial [Aggregatilineales bacterium]|nr:protein kinase [Aggregatilineales bacterium]